MKIVLMSIGKNHDADFAAGIEEFTKRLKKYFTVEWTLIAPPKNAASLTIQELKKQEAQLVHALIDSNDFLVLLDETGKIINSLQVAALLEQQMQHRSKRIIFLIGGAFGVDETVKKRANFCWSLSLLVFPHMLVRLILAEQLYRAATILKNEKYHHI